MANTKKNTDILLDDGLGELEVSWVSLDLTPENAKFTRSKGKLVSLELTTSDGETLFFERVIVLRAFPISNPYEFLSVHEVSPFKNGVGKEIGMIRRLSDFDEETAQMITEELALRYFIPEITKIKSVKEKYGYYYWDIETDAGNNVIILETPFRTIRRNEAGEIMFSAIDGCKYRIPDEKKLDTASYKRLEFYI